MQGRHAKRHGESGDNDHRGGGGPAGAIGPAPKQAAGEDSIVLDIETARAVKDFYLRGGARNFVKVRIQTPSLLRSMRQSGLVELQMGVRGAQEAKLTPRGLRALTVATKMIASAPERA